MTHGTRKNTLKLNEKVTIKESNFLPKELHNKVAKVVEIVTENVVKVKLSNGSIYKLYNQDLAEQIEVMYINTKLNRERKEKYYKMFETENSWYVREVGARGKRGGFFIPKGLKVVS